MEKVYHKNAKQLTFAHLFFDKFWINNLNNTKIFDLKDSIDFELYRPIVEGVMDLEQQKSGRGKKSNAGRRPFDPVFMLKVLFLERILNMADEAFEDSLRSDMRLQAFLDIFDPREIPDARTIWRYRNLFSIYQVFEEIFEKHQQTIKKLDASVGEKSIIVDGSFVEAPKQRNTREENELIKKGLGASLWHDNPHKKCHKDIDARWTKKRQETHYGYKINVLVCAISKVITAVVPTAASVHDVVSGKTLIGQLTEHPEFLTTKKRVSKRSKDAPCLYADSGYTGKEFDTLVSKKGWKPNVCEKAQRGTPLTNRQKKKNAKISSVRSRIEHVFGFIEESLNGSVLRSVGMIRARAWSFLTCWVYNCCRVCCLQRVGSIKTA